jgi:hypothetical protein
MSWKPVRKWEESVWEDASPWGGCCCILIVLALFLMGRG